VLSTRPRRCRSRSRKHWSIAFGWGFSESNSFSRTFRNAFQSPRRFRSACRKDALQRTGDERIATSLFNAQWNRAIRNEATQKAIKRAISTGWRRSRDRAGLQANSLQTGNFTGKPSILAGRRPDVQPKAAALQRLSRRFPAPANREKLWSNRVLSQHNGQTQQVIRVRSPDLAGNTKTVGPLKERVDQPPGSRSPLLQSAPAVWKGLHPAGHHLRALENATSQMRHSQNVRQCIP
jgi:hypothetical protein